MAKQGPSRERRSYWQVAIELQRESGLAVREFCQQEGLSEPSFYAWRRRLTNSMEDAASQRDSQPAFVPVEITSGEARTESALVIELTTGVTLRIREGCSPELLRTAVEALGC